jgi:DNA-binding NarL/FixJ family response regulator
MSATIRVFLVTGPVPFTSRIAAALLPRAEVAIVGRASPHGWDGAARPAAPDVLLVDTGLPPAEGAGVVRRARGDLPDLPIAVGVPEDCAEAILAYSRSGAHGYLGRADPADDLVEGLRRLRRGESTYPASAALALFRTLREGPPGAGPGPLSRRETEVLRLLATGLLNKEIASRLGISLCTVKNHIHKILGKLRASHRRDAVYQACQQGLLGEGPGAAPAARAGPGRDFFL